MPYPSTHPTKLGHYLFGVGTSSLYFWPFAPDSSVSISLSIYNGGFDDLAEEWQGDTPKAHVLNTSPNA